MPSKTATGTVAIQVEDFNDHCPTLTNKTQTMCTTAEVVYATAEDKDVFPNAGPFTFIVMPEGTDGKWSVEHLNGMRFLVICCDIQGKASYFIVKITALDDLYFSWI